MKRGGGWSARRPGVTMAGASPPTAGGAAERPGVAAAGADRHRGRRRGRAAARIWRPAAPRSVSGGNTRAGAGRGGAGVGRWCRVPERNHGRRGLEGGGEEVARQGRVGG